MLPDDLDWRLLITGEESGAWNMAVDEVLMDTVRNSIVPRPTLRFYGWNPPTITIGYAQQAERDLDLDACRRDGVDVVRRLTGGRAVLHQEEITYSIIVPEELLPGSIVHSYQVISQGLLQGLRLLGLDAQLATGHRKQYRSGLCFDAPSWYELLVDGKKIIGSAQARKRGVVLQHGSIPLNVEPARLAFYLAVKQPVKERLYKQAIADSACLSRWIGDKFNDDELIQFFVKGFQAAFRGVWHHDELSPDELRQAGQLAESRYFSM